jgi:Flp pilus assembly pilin Flp
VLANGARLPAFTSTFSKDRDMLTLLNNFRQDESGATATEYAMLIVFIALGIAFGAQLLGNGINTLFSNIGASLAAVSLPSI